VSLFKDVLRGERPHIIIDPGLIKTEFHEPAFESLLQAMQSDGLRAEDVGLIIITHAHMDHYQATEALVEKTREKASKGIEQAIVTISREEEEYLRNVGEKQFGILGIDVPKFEPFFYLTEGELNVGKEQRLTLQILETPGHSPGSISIYWPDRKVLITGDVVFYGGMGRTDLPGGSMTVLKQSIEKLSKLDVEYLVAGHSTQYGGIIKGKDNVMRNFQAVKVLV
jgi:glyoxylase-like metal-dependent hydrolase (beta-lactamase superfamily II)